MSFHPGKDAKERMWGRRKAAEAARSNALRNRLDSVLGIDPYGSARKPDACRNPDQHHSGGAALAASTAVALAGDGLSLQKEGHVPAQTSCAQSVALYEVSAGPAKSGENWATREMAGVGVLCCH